MRQKFQDWRKAWREVYLRAGRKAEEGEVLEEDILDDFQELDYLEARRDELLAAMKSLPQQ